MAKPLVLKKDPIPARAIAFDTETTGLSPRTGHRIVELAGIELIHGKPSGREFHSYINPERSIPPEAARVHGLTISFLRDKPKFKEVLPQWLDFIGDDGAFLWAHNAPFDERFMLAEQEMEGHSCGRTYNCSLRLARSVFGKGSYSLAALAERAGVSFTGRGAHSAIADAHVLGGVLTGLLWPQEAIVAADGTAAPRPKAASEAKPSREIVHNSPLKCFALPQDFKPLGPQEDDRIRRYDNLDVSHLLSKRGQRWTPQEEARLGETFLISKTEIPDLVADFGRSPAALLLKLEALGVVVDHPYTRR